MLNLILSSLLTLFRLMSTTSRRLDERRKRQRELSRRARAMDLGKWPIANSAQTPALRLNDPFATLPEIKAHFGSGVSLVMTDSMNCSLSFNTGLAFINLAQGILKINRVGRSVTFHRLRYRGVVKFDPTVSTVMATTVWVLLMFDMQFRGHVPMPTDVFTTPDGGASDSWMLNQDNKERFKLIRVWKHSFSLEALKPGGAVKASQVATLDLEVPLNLRCTYTDAAGSLAETRGPACPFLAYGSSHGVATFSGGMRAFFTDV